MIRAVLFDFYGVICSDEYWYKVRELGSLNGSEPHIKALSQDVNLGLISWSDYCRQVAQDLGKTEAEIENNYAKYRLNRQVIAQISSLKEQGIIVALASNAHHDQLQVIFAENGLDNLFDHLYISSELGVAKPSPAFFEHIISDLKISPSEMVMVDDLEPNINAAAKLGLRTVLFRSENQLAETLAHLLSTAE